MYIIPQNMQSRDCGQRKDDADPMSQHENDEAPEYQLRGEMLWRLVRRETDGLSWAPVDLIAAIVARAEIAHEQQDIDGIVQMLERILRELEALRSASAPSPITRRRVGGTLTP